MTMRKRIFALMLVLPVLFAASLFAGDTITLKDPIGDDDGPGVYVYPTDPVYKPGSFDITKVVINDKGGSVEISVTVRAPLDNPWSMASGFSVQSAYLFIDMDGKENSGHRFAIPGLNAEFTPLCYWEKAVIISPQPSSRVKTEIKTKAADIAADIIVPIKVIPRGKTFTAIIKKEALGGDVGTEWGWQLLLTSNEGYPGPNEILTRRVNEYEGQHRFGGGDDYDGDPHFMDMLIGPGMGGGAEKDLQHKIMTAYKSGPDPSRYQLVKLPMVYPGKEMKIDVAAAEPADAPAQPAIAAPAPPRPAVRKKFGLKASGKLFTNFMHGNDTNQFSNLTGGGGRGGHNGIVSELEINLVAKVSDYAEVGARIKNRFRNNFWATYWDNARFDKAQYMKLRGVWGTFRTPDWMQGIVDTIHMGSHDLGLFSPWTIGRLRYIDRDNASGVFIGAKVSDFFSYDFARISLPSLWAGPGWTTGGVDDDDTGRAFINKDYAYAANLRFNIQDRYNLRFIGYYSKDIEGDPDDDNPRDGTDYVDRFENTVYSVELDANPVSSVQFSGVYAYADTKYNADNYTAMWGGWNSMPAKDLSDSAIKMTLQLEDPLGIGVSFAAEYFNIGEDYLSMMASRREQDLLLTEGFEGDDMAGRYNLATWDEKWRWAGDWGGFSGTRGQTVSAIADNSELQFDEQPYESIIGWNGLTFLGMYGSGGLDLTFEFTTLDFNTNMQGRDITVYPHQLRIWNENQERKSTIALARWKYTFDIGRTVDFSGKVKYIKDTDEIDLGTVMDDYESKKWIYDLGLGIQVADQLYGKIGYTLFDDDMSVGGMDQSTKKHRLYLIWKYTFGGVRMGAIAERYTGEDWAGGTFYDDWELFRSRIFLEIAF